MTVYHGSTTTVKAPLVGVGRWFLIESTAVNGEEDGV